jgi:hypothetical protein
MLVAPSHHQNPYIIHLSHKNLHPGNLFFTMMNLLVLFLFLLTSAAASHEWLTAKSKEDGVTPLGDQGLLYVKKFAGWGVFYPLDAAKVLLFYQIFDIDNDLLDESQDEPPEISVGNLTMPAMKMAMSIMVEGDELELYVPAELGHPHTTEPFRLRLKFADWFPSTETPLDQQRISALTCNLCAKEGCNEQELQYVRNFYKGMRGNPSAMRNEVIRLQKNINDGMVRTADDYNWSERKIFLLPQMAKLEEDRMASGSDDYLFPDEPDQVEEDEKTPEVKVKDEL